MKDPIGFDGENVNLYVYVWASPTNYTDSNGLDVDWEPRHSTDPTTAGLSIGSLYEGHWTEMAFRASMAGFTVTGRAEKTGHNPGSAHYRGDAIDVRTWDKTDAEIDDFIDYMRDQGYHVKDERTRPPGQRVWSGPHLHIEWRPLPPPPSPPLTDNRQDRRCGS